MNIALEDPTNWSGRMNKRSILAGTCIFSLVLMPLACKKPNVWETVPGGPLKVLVSFPPLYCFAKNVAGDDAKVVSLLTTQGPHDYQPTADQSIMARPTSSSTTA